MSLIGNVAKFLINLVNWWLALIMTLPVWSQVRSPSRGVQPDLARPNPELVGPGLADVERKWPTRYKGQ